MKMISSTPFSVYHFFLFLFLANTIFTAKVTNPKNPPKNAILLSKVESLTFRSNKMTTARRVSPIPQLNCIGPASVCSLYSIDMMRCTNEGADYETENIQWACKASLPEEFKLGSTEVMCEGYASSEDPFVLKGSCGVEYRLLLTEKGEDKYGRQRDDSSDIEAQPLFIKVIVFAIFGVVLFIIFSRLLEACRRNPPRLGRGNRRGGGGGPWFGGGGGGDDNSNDPPPPYDSHRFDPPRKTQRSYGSTSSAGSSSQGQQQNQNQNQNQGWRPGPWTAGLAGAGLGYALGRNQGQRETRPTQRPRGGLFGGGDGGGGGSNYRDPGPSRPATSPPSFSSSRYESTGFGGTSRR